MTRDNADVGQARGGILTLSSECRCGFGMRRKPVIHHVVARRTESGRQYDGDVAIDLVEMRPELSDSGTVLKGDEETPQSTVEPGVEPVRDLKSTVILDEEVGLFTQISSVFRWYSNFGQGQVFLAGSRWSEDRACVTSLVGAL